jgi:hypothetical protein
MSRSNNVNPDHYKVAGRLRPNEEIVPLELERQKLELKRVRRRKRAKR